LQIAAPPLSPSVSQLSVGRRKRPLWRELYVLVAAGAVLGAVAGAVFPAEAAELKPLGDAFISLIKMTITPLIFLVVVTGIAQVGDMRAVGRIGLKALVYFEAVTTLCLLFSLVVVRWVQPGAGVAHPTAQQAETAARFAQAQVGSVSAYIQHMIPDSFVGAFASGDVLQVLVLALLCGIGLLLLGERGTGLRTVWSGRRSGRRHGVHRSEVRACDIVRAGAFGRHRLGHDGGLHLRRVRNDLPVGGNPPVRLAPPAAYRTFGGSRHLVFRNRDTGNDGEASGGRRGAGGGGAGHSLRLLLQSRWRRTHPAAEHAVRRPGLRDRNDARATVEPVRRHAVHQQGPAGVTGGAFAALAETVLAAGLPAEGLALLLGIDRFMSLARAITNTIGNAVAAVVVAKWDGEFDSRAWTEATSQAPTAKL
jgi:aerobic C4-dicarboxylate transport protein